MFRRSPAAVVVVALLLVGAGCTTPGSDASPATGPTTGSASATTTTAPSTTTTARNATTASVVNCPDAWVGVWGQSVYESAWERDEVRVGYRLGPQASVFLVVSEDGRTLGVDRRTTGDGGVHADGHPIELDAPLDGTHALRVRIYNDSNGNGRFDGGDEVCRSEDGVVEARTTLDYDRIPRVQVDAPEAVVGVEDDVTGEVQTVGGNRTVRVALYGPDGTLVRDPERVRVDESERAEFAFERPFCDPGNYTLAVTDPVANATVRRPVEVRAYGPTVTFAPRIVEVAPNGTANVTVTGIQCVDGPVRVTVGSPDSAFAATVTVRDADGDEEVGFRLDPDAASHGASANLSGSGVVASPGDRLVNATRTSAPLGPGESLAGARVPLSAYVEGRETDVGTVVVRRPGATNDSRRRPLRNDDASSR